MAILNDVKPLAITAAQYQELRNLMPDDKNLQDRTAF